MRYYMIETTKDMISVWMGTSFKTPDEFNEYTDVWRTQILIVQLCRFWSFIY